MDSTDYLMYEQLRKIWKMMRRNNELLEEIAKQLTAIAQEKCVADQEQT